MISGFDLSTSVTDLKSPGRRTDHVSIRLAVCAVGVALMAGTWLVIWTYDIRKSSKVSILGAQGLGQN